MRLRQVTVWYQFGCISLWRFQLRKTNHNQKKWTPEWNRVVIKYHIRDAWHWRNVNKDIIIACIYFISWFFITWRCASTPLIYFLYLNRCRQWLTIFQQITIRVLMKTQATLQVPLTEADIFPKSDHFNLHGNPESKLYSNNVWKKR